MSFKCETCNTTFITKTNLNTHKKSAKYCIKLRESSTVESTSSICHICFQIKHIGL